MRTGVDGGTNGYYNSQRFDTWERIKVANGSGTMVDVSMRFTGYNLQLPQPNLPIGALTVDFARDASPSLAPFVVASTLNRLDDGTTYSPLLQIGRTVTMEIAIGEQGSGPAGRPSAGSSLWYEVFRGTISNVKWPQFGSHVASITVLDLGGVLQKMKSQAEYTYTAGTAIETVAQQILTNNGATWVSFSCPVATGKVLPNDVKPGLQKTVWEQLANLFRQAGMVLWWRYTGNSTLQLVAFEPPRNKTLVDQTFSIVADYIQLEIDENDIGSTGYIVYYDENGVQQTIGPMVDSASVAKYGGQYGMERPFWIVLTADSPVRDGTSALALLTQALSDVADPDVVATVTMPPLWFGEAAVDLYEFPTITGWLFDSPLDAAPFSITIQRQGDQQPYTSVSVRGKPSAGRKTWQIVGGGQIITSYGLNGSNLILADTIDSFQLGPTVPYISAGGATDAWPRRAFTVNTASDLTTWSLGALFKENVGNVAAYGPQGLENYLLFQNTNTISGPNLGIISNAELQGYGGIVTNLSLFTGGLVINSNAGGLTGTLTVFDAGGVQRVTGATSTVSGKVVGFRGTVPATHAAVTGTSWNLYMEGTAPNFLAARTYIGTALGNTWMEQGGSSELKISNHTIPGTDASFDLGTSSFRWRDGRLSRNLFAEALGRIGSQTAGTGLVVGSQTLALDAGSLTSNVGMTLYADFNAAAVAFNYVNPNVGTGAGLTQQFIFANSAGTLTRAGLFRATKVGAWTSGTATTQNADYSWYLARDGVNSLTMSLSSKGNLVLMGQALGGGVGVFGMADATTAPTSTPAGGSILWSAGGILKTRSAFDALGGFAVGGAMVINSSGALTADVTVTNALTFGATGQQLRTNANYSIIVRSGLTTAGFLEMQGSGAVAKGSFGWDSVGIGIWNASGVRQLSVSGTATTVEGALATYGTFYLGPASTVNLTRTTISGTETIKSSGAVDCVSGYAVNGALVVNSSGAFVGDVNSALVTANTAFVFGTTGQRLIPYLNSTISLKSGVTTSGFQRFLTSADVVKGLIGWDATGFGLAVPDGTMVLRALGTDAASAVLRFYSGVLDSQGADIVGHKWGTSGPPAGTYTNGTIYFQHDA